MEENTDKKRQESITALSSSAAVETSSLLSHYYYFPFFTPSLPLQSDVLLYCVCRPPTIADKTCSNKRRTRLVQLYSTTNLLTASTFSF